MGHSRGGSLRVQWNDFMVAMNHVFGVYSPSNETASDPSLDEDDKDSKRTSASSPLQDASERNRCRIDRLYSLRSMDQSQSLLQSSATLADHLCTDPRDKIYALLGITNPGFDPNQTGGFLRHACSCPGSYGSSRNPQLRSL